MLVIVQVLAQSELTKVTTAYLLANPEVGSNHEDTGGRGGTRPVSHVASVSTTGLTNSEIN